MIELHTIAKGIGTIFVSYLLYSVFIALYNITLHPLAKFPGPRLRGAYHFLKYYNQFKGTTSYETHELHEAYGDVVRIAPDTISIIKAEAWKDIHGYGNKNTTKKDPLFYIVRSGEPADIISANDKDHFRIRRLMNNAFSEQAVRAQEGIINTYISLMIQKLRKHAIACAPIDIMKYLNFTTFDITRDLTFDEPFGSLESENYNHWIKNILDAMHFGSLLMIMRAYNIPVMDIIDYIPPLRNLRDSHENYTKEKTARRIAKKTDRKDFLSYVLKPSEEGGMTHAEIRESAASFILAGSETSATVLSGIVYYLCQNPAWYTKLREEMDTTFAAESEITLAALSPLKILNAIIQETIRMYPPVPIALPRIIPDGGLMVAGTFIPANTNIGIPQPAAYRSSRSWKDPNTFEPKRWLGDENYANDNRAVVQPFAVGPRNCIGQNLAWAEIRLILTRLLWHFDIKLVDPNEDWVRQKVFVLWAKPSLMVRLTARQVAA